MQRHITVLQINHFLGSHDKLSRDEKVDLAKELIDRHKYGLLFGMYDSGLFQFNPLKGQINLPRYEQS